MRERILAFIHGLRDRALPVSVSEALDAVQAVAAAGIERDVLREALAAALVKDERLRATFDGWFEECFPLLGPPEDDARRKRRRTAQGGAGEGIGRSGSVEGHGHEGTAAAGAPAPSGLARRPLTPPAPQTPRQSLPPGRGSGQDRQRPGLMEKPFAEFTAHDVVAARELVEALARALRARLSRRTRRQRHGRVDVRRTIRAAAGTGFVPVRLEHRSRRPRRPDLLALCDLSGSVAAASELCLGLLAPAAGWFGRVDTFVYVDHPVAVSIESGHVAPAGFLDLHARSDFGRVLADLWRQHESRLARNTVVVVLGDARNNRLPPRIDLLRRLRARVQRLVWLVPEPEPRWNTGDSVLALYAAQCDAVIECTTLATLARAVRRLFL